MTLSVSNGKVTQNNETRSSYELFYGNIPVMPQLRRTVAGFPPRRPGLDPRSGHEGFVVAKVALKIELFKCDIL
jgi:hypothetical protein